MKVLWTATAQQNRDTIYRYLAHETGRDTVSKRVDAVIESSANLLIDYPLAGREGRIVGTRELLTQRFPYMLVYRVAEGRVIILRVLHQAQRWPRRL